MISEGDILESSCPQVDLIYIDVLMDINPEAVEIAKSRISGLQELGL